MKYDREGVLSLAVSQALDTDLYPGELRLEAPVKCSWGRSLGQCRECWRKALEPILAPSEEETK